MYRSAVCILEEFAEQDSNNNVAKFTAIKSGKVPDFFLNTAANQLNSPLPPTRKDVFTATGQNRKPSPVAFSQSFLGLTQFQAPPKKSMMELRQERMHSNIQEIKPRAEHLYSAKTTAKRHRLEEEHSKLLVMNVLNTSNKQQIPTSVDWKGWRVTQPLDVVATRDRRHPLPGSLVQTDKCCCQRPTRTVYCLACGFHVHGNIKRMCPIHPKHIFLSDLECCGNRKCRTPCHLLETD